MFGYVKPLQQELKVGQLQVYKAIYCGLCKQLGKAGGQRARFLLSYDMTFLALVALSLSEQPPSFKSQCCIAHPLKKRETMLSHPALDLAADAALFLFYYQCKDNINDCSFFSGLKYRLALPLAVSGKRRAQKRRPELFSILEEYQKSQQTVEESDSSIDKACDPTGIALGKIAEIISPSKKLTPVLYRVGYMMGRYIYLIDAVDDLSSDFEKGRFNPLIERFSIKSAEDIKKDSLKNDAEEMLNLTIAQLAAAYELLPRLRYQEILDNIIYLGLPAAKNRVLQTNYNKEKENEQSIPSP